MASFLDSFDELVSVDSFTTESSHPFNNEEGYTPPVYSDFANPDSIEESVNDSVIFNDGEDGVLGTNPVAPIYGFESNGGPATANGVFVDSDGPILPPPSEMQEEGPALREWRRKNAILLEQKEKREKEIMSQIIEEANEYKTAFHEKRKVTCENNKTNNREREKVFLTNQETFHKEVDKNYWKAIAELVPNEVPTLDRKRGKKEQEKKPSIVVVQGPKPGKPTDLARMRQILVKLKHAAPTHLKLTPTPAETSKPAVVGSSPEATVAA